MLGKFLLVFVFQDVDLFPSIVFDSLTKLFVLFHHGLDGLFQTLSLLSLAVQLDFLILLKFIGNLLVVQSQLVQSLFKLGVVSVFLSLKLVESLLVCIHFVGIVVLAAFHVLLVLPGDVVDPVLVGIFSLLLGVIELIVPLLVLDSLVVNLPLKVINLPVFAIKILLLGGLLLLLLDLNLILKLLDLCLLLVLL